MIRKILLLTLLLSANNLSAKSDDIEKCMVDVLSNMAKGEKLVIDNKILATINGEHISVLDVKKKIDFILKSRNPSKNLTLSEKFLAYNSQWRHALHQMIFAKLIEWDSKSVSKGDIPENIIHGTILDKFGVKYLEVLDDSSMTLEDARKIVKKDLFVRQMNSLVAMKARDVPKNIRMEYDRFVKKNPETDVLEYRIVTVSKSTDNESPFEHAKIVYDSILKGDKDIDSVAAEDKAVKVSKLYTVNAIDLNSKFRTILSKLDSKEFSSPIEGRKRAQIFYLHNKSHFDPPSFVSKYLEIEQELMMKNISKIEQNRFKEFEKRYGYSVMDDDKLNSFTPFRLV